MAEGWDLKDFGKPWPRGPLPPEALVSEFIVGFLDRERGAGVEWSAAELGGAAATYFVQHGLDAPCITDHDLRQLRDKRRELFAQWAALPVGETLELPFGGGTCTHRPDTDDDPSNELGPCPTKPVAT